MFNPDATLWEQAFETLKIFIHNELQVYNYIQKYLSVTEVTDQRNKAIMENFLKDTKKNFHSFLSKIQSGNPVISQDENKAKNEVLNYIEKRSTRILELKELLIPEWDERYINASIIL